MKGHLIRNHFDFGGIGAVNCFLFQLMEKSVNLVFDRASSSGVTIAITHQVAQTKVISTLPSPCWFSSRVSSLRSVSSSSSIMVCCWRAKCTMTLLNCLGAFKSENGRITGDFKKSVDADLY